MKNLVVYVIFALLCIGFSGCRLPDTTVKAIGSHPGLVIKNAPENAVLYVDNVKIGLTDKFSGGKKSYLELSPGSHRVIVRTASGRIIENRDIFVESEITTITLSPH